MILRGVFAGLLCAMPLQGAPITWTAGSFAAETDVVNAATVVDSTTYPVTLEALNFNGDDNADHSEHDVTINGVVFAGFGNTTGNSVLLNPSGTHFSADTGNIVSASGDNYDGSPSAAVAALLGNFLYGGTTLTLTGLAPGEDYLVQVFMGDRRVQSDPTKHEWLKLDGATWNAGTNTPIFRDATGTALGVWATGTFTADAATQVISLVKWRTGTDATQGTSDDTSANLHLDAYQLRSTALPETPGAPTGLAATPGDGQVELDWNDNPEPDLDFYRVSRATAPGGPPYSEIGTPAGSTFIDSSVTNGTTYYYVVSAVDTDTNESAESAEVDATPQVPVPDIDLAGDSDGDGLRDTMELSLGTDPFDGASAFTVSVESDGAGGAMLSWPSTTGVSYSVGFSTDLAPGSWQTIAGPFDGTGAALEFNDTDPVRTGGERGFYVVMAHLPPPNIVLLMSDDHVGMAMGNMNHPDHPEVLTPSMDLLASRGVRFDRAYANTAICRPSRATTFTGVYEYKHVTNFSAPNNLATSLWNESYPVLLKNAGYRIGFAGKWGFGMELSEAQYSAQFDKWGGFSGDGQGNYNTASNPAGIAAYATEFPHVSRALGAFGRDFIRESVTAAESFCLTVFFKAPHMPFGQYDAEEENKYDHVSSFARPTTWDDSYNSLVPDQPKFARPHQRRWTTDSEYQSSALGYYRLVSGMDAAVGMVMDELETRGVAHNTVVIYTSDNGYFLGSHGGWHGKVMPHEEGSRIPLIIYDPRAPLQSVGRTSQAIVGNIDYAPTVLNYVGIPIPSNMDGLPLQPLIKNPSGRVRDAMLLIQNWTATDDDLSRALCVVTEQHKYTFWPYGDPNVTPAEEVYDIPADPFETSNLAATLDTGTLNQLRAHYGGFVQDWKDNVPSGVTDYERMGALYDRSLPYTSKTFDPIPAGSSSYRSNYQDVTGVPYPF